MPKIVQQPLTELAIRKAKPADKRYDLFDASVRGLGLRVATSGTKSWFMMRRFKGRMLRSTFGRYPDLTLANARLKAPDVLSNMADGLMQGQRRTDLFKVVLDEWLKKDQAKNKSTNQVKIAMYRHALPAFGPMPVASISKRDVNRLIDTIVDAGSPIAANRVLAFTKRFFSWCKERDILEKSPAEAIRPPSKEKTRDRVLSLDEMKDFWAACDQMGYPWGPLFQLLLLTGARLREVSQASWNEISIEDGTLNLPSSRTKNARPHQIQLSDQALNIIQDLPKIDGQNLLFTTNGTTPVSGFSKVKKRLDILSGVINWRFHDLRRSFATHSTEKLGISPVIADKILNHVTGQVRGVAAIYQHGEYLEERRIALQRWGNFIEGLVADE
ncbi:tyrosine-type recombinase/integrase [Rhodobacteraceae bacterium]|jgi:integrase|nr:tyrosine-type recombinase/integrase [Paracoccaceae bacterium]